MHELLENVKGMREVLTQVLTKEIRDLCCVQPLAIFFLEGFRGCIEGPCQLVECGVTTVLKGQISKQLNRLENLLASGWWLGNDEFSLYILLRLSNL